MLTYNCREEVGEGRRHTERKRMNGQGLSGRKLALRDCNWDWKDELYFDIIFQITKETKIKILKVKWEICVSDDKKLSGSTMRLRE